MKPLGLLACLTLLALEAQVTTRGVGVYPGDPRQYFGPDLRPASGDARNLALRRMAYQSSSYDYNLTAQLATDGIVAKEPPRQLIVVTSAHGTLKKNEREWLVDGNWVTGIELKGRKAWVEFLFQGGSAPLEFDSIELDAGVAGPRSDNQDWTLTVNGSEDGKQWRKLGQVSGMARPTGEIRPRVPLAAAGLRRIRLDLASGRSLTWKLGDVSFFRNGQRIHVAGPHHFTSAWVPATSGEEWIALDLGAESRITEMRCFWLRPPAAGQVQISRDGHQWTRAAVLEAPAERIRFSNPLQSRFVRLLLTRAASGDGYALSEWEVLGHGGVTPVAQPLPPAEADGAQRLSGGSWRIERASQVTANGRALSQPGFADQSWLPATVPGTALVSYLNAGAIPDPNFSGNINAISDSYFHSDFWYRCEFPAASPTPGGKLWLDFDGINWKADVWLNGEQLGRIEGAFQRARFDITAKVKSSGTNALAVRVEKNATPGSVKEKTYESPDKNGGALGADNPTFHASIGWDWIPTIRGRNTGVWNNVWLRRSGLVTLADPAVNTLSIEPARARVQLQVLVRNHGAATQTRVRGTFGDLSFEQTVPLAANEEKLVTLAPLDVTNPRLWWPNGYGEPSLYPVRIEVGPLAGPVSDTKTFQAGIRQWRYSEEGGSLRLWVNGRRFVPRGGNWGFSEFMLRYRAREYDAAVRFHRHSNFTMIRNWVGQVGEEEFYEACDRHGIVVWQDFWLANPWDGPEPDNLPMFLANARDTVRRIRHHSSVALYCARNEGYPPQPLDEGLRAILAEEHPGVHYIGSSADDVVSGHGPYRALPVKEYFAQRATPQFHSEMGMPSIVTPESLASMMKPEERWPMGALWGQHDFCLTGAQGGASFRERIEKSYGGANQLEDWLWLAQFVNYEGYRAMFEAQSKNRMGLLIWMSHPAWPSMVWQTYDYYFDTSAAYFAARKASEPLHIQWNPLTDQVEVVNYHAGPRRQLKAQARLLNLDGAVQWEQQAVLDSPEDSVQTPIQLQFPASLSEVHFVRLELTEEGRTISTNIYWRGRADGDFRALRQIPPAKVRLTSTKLQKDGRWLLRAVVENQAPHPALLVRLKTLRRQSRDRITPAFYDDNYLVLMPGEKREIGVELSVADARGEEPELDLDGFNVTPAP